MTRPEPWQTRVMAEANELQLKIHALDHFVWSEKMLDLSCAQRRRMHRQLNAMQTYLEILNERIEEFQ